MDSEFRQDLVSSDWVLIAAGRGKRPHTVKKREDNYQKPEDCPFENPQASGNGEALLMASGEDGEWLVQVIRNQFPAVSPGLCGPIISQNGYQVTAGVGFHELVIMREHNRFFHNMTSEQAAIVLGVYRDRYVQISQQEKCGQYIMIFNNYGREGGASIYHPHSQIISVPIIPPDVMRSLRGSYRYFKQHGGEAHAVMIEQEQKEKKRIVFENDQFIAFCPFVSKHPYEVRLYPKFADGHFEHIEDASLTPLAEALTTVLRKIHDTLGDPSYNFFVHTAPLHFENTDLTSDQYYRWHIEILPRVTFDAGFEVGTGIKINIIDPDVAAETLNGNHHE